MNDVDAGWGVGTRLVYRAYPDSEPVTVVVKRVEPVATDWAGYVFDMPGRGSVIAFKNQLQVSGPGGSKQ